MPTSLLVIVAISFWSGFVVRTYAWLVILGSNGPIATTYTWLFGQNAPQMVFTSFSSTIGMVHILLPYMTMVLYGVMTKVDGNHVRAATSLGASPTKAFYLIYLPLTFPGVVNGSILVFTICVGFFVTPILLGGTKDIMISQLISEQISELLAWGFSSSLSVILLCVTGLIFWIYNRLVGLDKLWG
jgi:putative spermidine/putrescine transport system permease protein